MTQSEAHRDEGRATALTGPGPGDARLARAAAGGDEAALRTVLERVTRRMRSAAWNLAKDGHDAQDLVQEALLKITRPDVLERYRGDGSLDGYLLSVGVRAMISAGRPRRAEAARSFSTAEPEMYERGRPDPDVGFLSDPVRHAIATLPERARAVVLLVAVGDLTYADVAEALGMEVGTVKSTYSRARGALRAVLEPSAGQ